jgi:hypothetical protein
MIQIQSIFIVSHNKEVISKRLYTFFSNLLQTELDNINIVLFMSDDISQEDINKIKKITEKLKLSIELYDNKLSINHLMFENVFLYKIHEYQTFLLLETDCTFHKLFLRNINNDLKSYNDFWIYGSFYYGAYTYFYHHANGVAVYNRTKEFNSILKSLKDSTNYDWIISCKLKCLKKFISKVIDSKTILNLSQPVDSEKSYKYKMIKNNTQILHTKNEELLKNCLK